MSQKGYGGAVIVNGRSDILVEMMVGKENLHHLLPLTDEDCWAIFTKASGVDLQIGPQVEDLRRIVAQGGRGHPFMAKLMGQVYKQVKHTAQSAADNCNVSAGEESPIRQANSSNGSSTAHVTKPESAQMEESIGPYRDEVIALQPVDSSGVRKNQLNRTKSLGSSRVKLPFGLSRSKTMGF